MSKRSIGLTSNHRFASLAALLLGATFSLGCARGPDVASGLGLRRVVIYRNGVAYFERQGHVDEDLVTFKVRTEKVGDFLATLAVIEQGGSSVRSASFPVDVVKDKDDDDGGGDEPKDPRLEMVLKPPVEKKPEKKDHLETVKLTLDGKEHDLIVGYVAETPVWRPSYRLVINKGSGGKGPEKADLQAWGIVQNLSGEDWKGVKLSLVAGAPLAFQATLEKPVVPPRPVVTDQGEVIASVPTGETSLAEAPPQPNATEIAPMGQPAPGTGGVTLDGLLAAQKEAEAGDEGGYYKADKKAERASGKDKSKASATRRPAKSSPKGGGGPAYDLPAPAAAPAMPPPPPPAPPRQNPSGPRNVRALAAVAMEGGATHFDLPFPVDIPNKSATMVLLVSKPVPGESIFLFAPDGGVPQSGSHPFRVVRFTNDTGGLLERGPIAVFEDGAFLGQGMVDPLPAGGTATVPFALERSLGVEQGRNENEQGARLAQIEGGRIEIERDWVTHTKYTVKNGSDGDAKVLVKHSRMWNTRLFDPPKGTEDNTGTGTALVPVEVAKHATKVLDVDERRVQRRGVDWLDPLADEAVKAYIADARADQAVVGPLRAAWEARGKLRTTLDEREKLQKERGQLDAQIAQLDHSIRAIEKNNLAAQLRKDLTERLAKASARMDEITKKMIVLDMQVSEQSIRFRDLVSPIKMVKPLPPP
ncbi:Hypothetical protein A7982_01777 [Minicystis rosea]|nr:Hypothetical protein A7982_01777 [Minicystis rosea]